jgi:hypothetical protein
VSIRDNVFSGCTGLTSITLPANISFGTAVFSHCTGLTNVIISDGIDRITGSMFSDCTGLTSITIPASVMAIESAAFINCTGLTSITCLRATPPHINSNTFQQTNNCPIYVPANSVNAYKSASYWSNIKSRIQAIPSE